MKKMNYEIEGLLLNLSTACIGIAQSLQAYRAVNMPIYDEVAVPMLISLLYDAVVVINQLQFFKNDITQENLRPMLKMASSSLEIAADVMNYSLRPGEYRYYLEYADARGVGDQRKMNAMSDKVKQIYGTSFVNICTRFYLLGHDKGLFASIHPNMIKAISQMREDYRVTLYSHHSGVENVNTLEDYQAAQLIIRIYGYGLLGACFAVSNYLCRENHLAFEPLPRMAELTQDIFNVLYVLEERLHGNPLDGPMFTSNDYV